MRYNRKALTTQPAGRVGNIGWSTLPDHQNAGDFGHKTVKTCFGVQINVTDRSGRCPECILRTVRLKTKFITFFKFCVDILSKRVQQICAFYVLEGSGYEM